MRVADLAKLLSCPVPAIHADISDHMVYGSTRGGCKLCERASRRLKAQIVAESDGARNQGINEVMTLAALIPKGR